MLAERTYPSVKILPEPISSAIPDKIVISPMGDVPDLDTPSPESKIPLSFINESKKDAKRKLPWLQQKSPAESAKDLTQRHVIGLKDAYVVSQITEDTDPEKARKAKVQLESWGERAEILTKAVEEIKDSLETSKQRAIEVKYATTLLRKFVEEADRQLPWLTQKEPSVSKKDLKLRHIIGLLDAYDATMITTATDPEEARKTRVRLESWGDRADALTSSIAAVDITGTRKEIIEESSAWEKSDILKNDREAYTLISQLPKEVKKELFNRSDLTPETFIDAAKRWGITTAATGMSWAIPNAAAWTGGVAVTSASFEQVGRPWLMVSVAVAAGIWGWGMGDSIKESNNLQEETGMGLKIQAKAVYDLVSRFTQSRKLKRIGGGIGYASTQVGAEPFWIFGLVVAVRSGHMSVDEALSFYAGATAGAGVGEKIVAKIVKHGKNRIH